MSVLIPLDKLRPDPANPRRAGVGDVAELAESQRLACELLNLAGRPPKGTYGATDFAGPLLDYAAEGPAQRERAALALALGAAEPPLRQDWPQWTTPEARRHFAFLEAQGFRCRRRSAWSSTARRPGRRL